ncbi:MAG: hypothetical protein CVV45_08515 [Spirochaetae bacterium HGW-Spirochaetae-10]|nr:MAG: hypothetical protein CVV45_08515 [Spirochaetae bacterium HGW-Spirochaetae-10]
MRQELYTKGQCVQSYFEAEDFFSVKRRQSWSAVPLSALNCPKFSPSIALDLKDGLLMDWYDQNFPFT